MVTKQKLAQTRAGGRPGDWGAGADGIRRPCEVAAHAARWGGAGRTTGIGFSHELACGDSGIVHGAKCIAVLNGVA